MAETSIFQDVITFVVLGGFTIVAIGGFMKKSPKEMAEYIKELMQRGKEEE